VSDPTVGLRKREPARDRLDVDAHVDHLGKAQRQRLYRCPHQRQLHPTSWMVPLRTYMQNRITDIAHTVATYRMEDGPHQDFPSARKVCAVGLDADPLAEVVHRSLMKVESQAGNRSGLQAAIARWQDTTRHLDQERIDATTQRLVDQLLTAS